MFPTHCRQQRFKLILLLTCWVILVCASKSYGVVGLCPVNETVQSEQLASTEAPQECDLSEQLLSAHQHQVDAQLFALLVIAVVVGLWQIVPLSRYHSFTEPISSPHRLHLRICVFRE
ncbi:hypothetical protein [Vibrio sp. SCSIO 43136]|uniref:hypothetical protein n=1 Tax=Vibrio sp. SCSIO 43136 TaxID=2819101 RepID=UPI0020755E66|nr:hypothetical protein [Vibrio sp. SCSIO 43136]USD66080.1 hypothetical protein J4N39_04465 [Vibrio sp. SCSIO 43136]